MIDGLDVIVHGWRRRVVDHFRGGHKDFKRSSWASPSKVEQHADFLRFAISSIQIGSSVIFATSSVPSSLHCPSTAVISANDHVSSY